MTRPSRFRIASLALAGFLVLGAVDERATHAQTSGGSLHMFLSFPGIEGGATLKGFERQVEIESVSVGVSSSSASVAGDKTRGSGKVVPSELALSKRADATSPLFFERATSGKAAPEVTITLVRGSQTVLAYKLSNVSVGSFQEQATSGGDVVDQLSLRYESLTLEATKSGKAAGVTKHGFNFTANRPL